MADENITTEISETTDNQSSADKSVADEQEKIFEIKKGVLIKYLGVDDHVLVPDEVTAIGDGAFKNKKTIISITLPENITHIGHYAFSGCKKLTSIEIPESVTTIGDYAFSGCKRLPTVDIPEAVRKIGRGAFNNTMILIH